MSHQDPVKTIDPIINSKQISEVVGLHQKTIRRLEERGEFPKAITLSERNRGYFTSEVNRWLQDRRRQS